MAPSDSRRPPPFKTLSAKLLMLTVLFVMLVEFLIWAPSVARYRLTYLQQRLASGHLAALALQATPDEMVSKELEKTLLFHVGAFGVVLRSPERRALALSEDMPPAVDVAFDLADAGFMTLIADAFVALGQDTDRIMRVMGPSPKDPVVTVEVILNEAPMRREMIAYSWRILQLSVVISLVTGGLLYLGLQWLMVRPLRRMTGNMTVFHDDPEDESRIIAAGTRADEIGIAQRELAALQRQVRAALKQKARLATLGAAVAKVNHDLRNSLATAVLVSDRLADIDDPEVQAVTPRLYDAIDRAVTLCSQTLDYVSDAAPRIRPTRFSLADLVGEVDADLLPPTAGRQTVLRNRVDPGLEVTADRNQLFRALGNIGRNAIEAGAGTVTVSAGVIDGRVRIDVADDGPGLSRRAHERLFQPFVGSARMGGTGLGLVIARDILRAHSGDVIVVATGPSGTTFRLELPA